MPYKCEHGAGVLHTSLACQYQALSAKLFEVNMFSTAALCAVFLAPACHIFGLAAQRIKLPRITGYLVAGVVAGPYALRLLNTLSVSRLWFVDQACLSLIALAAGAELQWEQLDKIKKQVALITLSISAATWLAVFIAMLPLAPYIDATADMSFHQVVAVCSLCATLMIARSPASAIAVLQETGGKGAFCSLVLAVVIVKDVVTIVAFSLNIEITRALFASAANARLTIATLIDPFVSVIVAMALGAAGSWVVSAASRKLSGALRGRASAPYVKSAVALALSMAVFEAAAFFDAEPLLACAVTGLLATNTLCAALALSMKDGDREDFHHTLATVMPAVNLAFFSLAGASLKLDAVGQAAWLGIVICGVRVGAIYVGSYVGCYASQCPPEQRKRMWQSMLTQAGVALGLARMVGVRFPSWGPHFQTLAASIIIINLCIGPPLFRAAIITIGESRLPAGSKPDHSSPQVVVRRHDDGFETRPSTELSRHHANSAV